VISSFVTRFPISGSDLSVLLDDKRKLSLILISYPMKRRFQPTGLGNSVLQEPKEKSIKTSNNILGMKIGYT
jgi:hypothetical protein